MARLTEEAIQAGPFLASDEDGNLKLTTSLQPVTKDTLKQTRPWVHFVAGGLGGMAGAVATAPLDVVKTRLQLSEFREVYALTARSNLAGGHVAHRNMLIQAARLFGSTIGIIHDVYRTEGFRACFKGLGPNLVGVIPARSINFFTYGTGKDWLARHYNDGQELTQIHLLAGINAGIVTLTATNPIWLVKTRLQLDKRGSAQAYRNLWECLKHIVRHEGVFALYRGLSASYLGSVESTLQWVLYEQMKLAIATRAEHHRQQGRTRTQTDAVLEWGQRLGAAGAAKFLALMITYPHEVVRTRLRQAPATASGKPKYTGLVQCFRLVIKEEGFVLMYGGLTAHLMRTVPNSIIMFGTWELVIKLLE